MIPTRQVISQLQKEQHNKGHFCVMTHTKNVVSVFFFLVCESVIKVWVLFITSKVYKKNRSTHYNWNL